MKLKKIILSVASVALLQSMSAVAGTTLTTKDLSFLEDSAHLEECLKFAPQMFSGAQKSITGAVKNFAERAITKRNVIGAAVVATVVGSTVFAYKKGYFGKAANFVVNTAKLAKKAFTGSIVDPNKAK